VHQLRVGVRRLRAAISLFADILDDPQTAAIKNESQMAGRRPLASRPVA
jgi:CHAD domain-containing protein